MKCPTCRRTVEELPATCPRCGTDLGVLNEIRRHARTALRQGMRLLRQARFAEASAALEKARKLDSSLDTARWSALAALGSGDYPAALTWHRMATKNTPETASRTTPVKSVETTPEPKIRGQTRDGCPRRSDEPRFPGPILFVRPFHGDGPGMQ